MFLADEKFICVDYCLEGDTYYYGTYKIENNKVNFKYNATVVQKEYNLERETDTINIQPEYIYRTEQHKSFQEFWIKFICKEDICFKTPEKETEYASIDQSRTAEKFFNELKKEGIWKRLNIQ